MPILSRGSSCARSRLAGSLTAVACLLAVVWPSALSAQVFTGRILDSASHSPVAGVLVLLLDSAGTHAARALSDQGGAFRLRAPAGAYRVRLLRIGFRPFTGNSIELRVGATVTSELVFSSQPVRLDAVRVVARNPCAALASDSSAVAVWEQARAAITAAQLTALSGEYEVTTLLHEGVHTPDLGSTRERHARLKSGRAVSAWLTLSADSIKRIGYVVTRADGSATYYAPDLDLLVSDDFAADHCFQLVREPGRRIGLRFQPNAEREVPEIRGTVWLDLRTAELRELDFAYTNLPSHLAEAAAGGTMRFARFGDGGWSVSEWEIRMPVVSRRPIQQVEPSGRVRRRAGLEPFVSEIHSGGGELVLVTRDSDTLWTGRRQRLVGSVMDSATSRGVRDVQVTLLPLNVAVRTDRGGRFAGPDVLPGQYSAMVRRSDGTEQFYRFLFTGPEQPVALRLSRAVRDTGVRAMDAWFSADVRTTDGVALPGVEASFPALGRSGHTDAQGHLRLDRLPRGPWRLVLRRLGYGPADTVLTLTAGDTTHLAVVLSQVVVRLDTVSVTASGDVPGGLPEFESRRLRRMGWFITTPELRAQDDRQLVDVLRSRLPGLGIQKTAKGEFLFNPGQQGPKALMTSTPCYVQIVIDGFPVFRHEGGAKPLEPPDFSMLATWNFDAVEYYSQVSRTPVEFRGAGAMCGTLVLWSRRK